MMMNKPMSAMPPQGQMPPPVAPMGAGQQAPQGSPQGISQEKRRQMLAQMLMAPRDQPQNALGGIDQGVRGVLLGQLAG